LVLDAAQAGYGGGGRTFDWSRARVIAAKRPVLLAGGLTPDNVAAAIATVRPLGVDVASGVESKPGTKDPRAVAAFVRAARSAA
jgi:phosphoribosylanthranilate isomerase